MLHRDDSTMRRLKWGAMLAAVLVLGTGTAAAQALWERSVALNAGTTTTGSLALTTQWTGEWTAWKPLFPGGTSDTAILRVTETAASGTTLRWRVTPAVSLGLTAEEAASVTTQVFVGNCGGSTTIAKGASYAPAGGFLPGESVDLCLRVTLAANASKELQNRPLTPTLSVAADQVVS
ncbi:hypothetical protein DBR36_11920 [Microbacterium sp. HMWF026]|uniref:hypothetical protein n=1 Tax=Microbacterium sp. HMWF026 TaxID=2056861 RepID=UPI000D34367F|nr:hypothetical protein [Microbacterium sp. HMWF026]PTT16938.1 hypothetical protein DBR36_11920 [Microbacterium sp. HMWF026]